LRKVAFLLTAAASLTALGYGLSRGEALKALLNGALLCLSCIGIG
jgi:Co/Zn/Cd efflux system component